MRISDWSSTCALPIYLAALKKPKVLAARGPGEIGWFMGQNFGPRLVLASPAPVGAPPLGRGGSPRRDFMECRQGAVLSGVLSEQGRERAHVGLAGAEDSLVGDRAAGDRKSVVLGKSVSVRLELG